VLTCEGVARQYGVRLTEHHDEEVPDFEVDEVKLRQAVVNLIVNALKFSPADGEVKVRVALEPDYARIEVNDRGPGILPADAAHIFELFGQGLRRTDGERGGLGIGLHLVKRLTELHGGHVGVNSAGSGSTFWIRLPLASSMARHDHEARAAA